MMAPMHETRLVKAWRRFSAHPLIRPFSERRIHLQWQLQGRPIPPPPLVKQAIVKAYLRRFRPAVVIETGTFAGEMTAALRGHVSRIISIELDPGWHARARERFRGAPEIE